MSFYIVTYIIGVMINIINFIDVISNNPIAHLKILMLNKKGLIITIIEIILFSLFSWILIFIDIGYKIYLFMKGIKK